MEENKIFYLIKNDTCFIKMFGIQSHGNSHNFNQMIESEIEKNSIKEFIINMEKTERIDSSVIGIFVKILKYLRKEKPIFLKVSQDLKLLFLNLGLIKYFILKDDYPNFPKSMNDLKNYQK